MSVRFWSCVRFSLCGSALRGAGSQGLSAQNTEHKGWGLSTSGVVLRDMEVTAWQNHFSGPVQQYKEKQAGQASDSDSIGLVALEAQLGSRFWLGRGCERSQQ